MAYFVLQLWDNPSFCFWFFIDIGETRFTNRIFSLEFLFHLLIYLRLDSRILIFKNIHHCKAYPSHIPIVYRVQPQPHQTPGIFFYNGTHARVKILR